MPCYCGLITPRNRVLWGCLAGSVVLGVVTYACGSIGWVTSFQDYTKCMNNNLQMGLVSQQDYLTYNLSNGFYDSKTRPPLGQTPNVYINICESVFVHEVMHAMYFVYTSAILFLLAIIPASIMCCCTRKPNSIDPTTMARAKVVTSPDGGMHLVSLEGVTANVQLNITDGCMGKEALKVAPPAAAPLASVPMPVQHARRSPSSDSFAVGSPQIGVGSPPLLASSPPAAAGYARYGSFGGSGSRVPSFGSSRPLHAASAFNVGVPLASSHDRQPSPPAAYDRQRRGLSRTGSLNAPLLDFEQLL